MNDKQFTDNFFRTMYELGYRKAEIEKGYIFFYEKPVTSTTWVPSIPIKCTCFTDEPQCKVDTPILVKQYEQDEIDIAEYLGVVDWSKVWEKRHFAYFKDGLIYAWLCGATSWSADYEADTTSWNLAKLAEV